MFMYIIAKIFMIFISGNILSLKLTTINLTTLKSENLHLRHLEIYLSLKPIGYILGTFVCLCL